MSYFFREWYGFLWAGLWLGHQYGRYVWSNPILAVVGNNYNIFNGGGEIWMNYLAGSSVYIFVVCQDSTQFYGYDFVFVEEWVIDVNKLGDIFQDRKKS